MGAKIDVKNALEKLVEEAKAIVSETDNHTDAYIAVTLEFLANKSTRELCEAMQCKPNLWTAPVGAALERKAAVDSARTAIISALQLYLEYVLDEWPIDTYSAPGDAGTEQRPDPDDMFIQGGD